MTDKQFNMIDSIFYYMWNAWSQEECSNVKWHHMASHFWDKWCGFSNKYGPHAAIAPFIAELDDNNRRALYERANTLYNGRHRRSIDLSNIDDCDMYEVYIDSNTNTKMLKVCACIHQREDFEQDKEFELGEYCWAEMPITDFILLLTSDNEDAYENYLSACKQYYTDLTRDEAEWSYNHYFGGDVLGNGSQAPTPLLYANLTADTPCGYYINCPAF